MVVDNLDAVRDAELSYNDDMVSNEVEVSMVTNPKSHVVSMRLTRQQIDRLQRIARRLGRTPSETGALLLEEALRRTDFAYIDFRDSPVGRQAYVHGSTLAVWEVVMIARACEMDVTRTSEHLQWPEFRTQAALNYAAAFPDEIEFALLDNRSYDFATVQRLLPHAALFVAEPAQPAYGQQAKEKSKPRRGRRSGR